MRRCGGGGGRLEGNRQQRQKKPAEQSIEQAVQCLFENNDHRVLGLQVHHPPVEEDDEGGAECQPVEAVDQQDVRSAPLEGHADPEGFQGENDDGVGMVPDVVGIPGCYQGHGHARPDSEAGHGEDGEDAAEGEGDAKGDGQRQGVAEQAKQGEDGCGHEGADPAFAHIQGSHGFFTSVQHGAASGRGLQGEEKGAAFFCSFGQGPARVHPSMSVLIWLCSSCAGMKISRFLFQRLT